MARLFNAYDVCETSHHLQIKHLDLHICDDVHAKDKGRVYKLTSFVYEYIYFVLFRLGFDLFPLCSNQ